MKSLRDKIKQLIMEWANSVGIVQLSTVEVYPSGIGSNIHVIIVANKGFESWERAERDNLIYDYLAGNLSPSELVKISLFLTMTEEEFERYSIAQA